MNRHFALLLSAIITGACARAPAGPPVLTVMTHDSFAVSDAIVQEFEQQTGAQVQFLPSGDAGIALNRAILSRQHPLADVFYGVDNTFLSRALEEDIFETYDSPSLANIPEAFQLDPTHRALPIDYGDVCLNYDRSYFDGHELPVPNRLEDLTAPAYRGLLVVENPATSSPGLAFLLATIGHFGEQGYLEDWRALRDNDLLVVNDWEAAYYGEFSGASAQGTRPLVVSYGSRPPLEGPYAEPPGHGSRHRRRHLLPPDRVRRDSAGDVAARPRRTVDRFHALGDLPGRHAPADVRLPGPPRGAPRPDLREVPGAPRTPRPGGSRGHRRPPRGVD